MFGESQPVTWKSPWHISLPGRSPVQHRAGDLQLGTSTDSVLFTPLCDRCSRSADTTTTLFHSTARQQRLLYASERLEGTRVLVAGAGMRVSVIAATNCTGKRKLREVRLRALSINLLSLSAQQVLHQCTGSQQHNKIERNHDYSH